MTVTRHDKKITPPKVAETKQNKVPTANKKTQAVYSTLPGDTQSTVLTNTTPSLNYPTYFICLSPSSSTYRCLHFKSTILRELPTRPLFIAYNSVLNVAFKRKEKLQTIANENRRYYNSYRCPTGTVSKYSYALYRSEDFAHSPDQFRTSTPHVDSFNTYLSLFFFSFFWCCQ